VKERKRRSAVGRLSAIYFGNCSRVERFIELGKYDLVKLTDVLARYNLIEKWQKISDKYRDSQA
jgi:hypothetical protein